MEIYLRCEFCIQSRFDIKSRLNRTPQKLHATCTRPASPTQSAASPASNRAPPQPHHPCRTQTNASSRPHKWQFSSPPLRGDCCLSKHLRIFLPSFHPCIPLRPPHPRCSNHLAASSPDILPGRSLPRTGAFGSLARASGDPSHTYKGHQQWYARFSCGHGIPPLQQGQRA